MSLVAIPSTFGTGGSGLNPTSDPTVNLQNILTQLTANVINLNQPSNPEEIVANGALTLGKVSRLTISGTMAFTLANGTVGGQTKRIFVVSDASTPSGVLTPAHASGFTTITFGAGSTNTSIDLVWDASLSTPAWKIASYAKFGTVTVT